MNIKEIVRLPKLLVNVLVLVCLISTSASQAKTLRCSSGKLVKEGDSTFEVKAKCGEPDEQEYLGTTKYKGSHYDIVRFVYAPARGQFIKIIEFHDGEVFKISNGSRIN